MKGRENWDSQERVHMFGIRGFVLIVLFFPSHVKYYTEAKTRSPAPLGVMKCFCINFHLTQINNNNKLQLILIECCF